MPNYLRLAAAAAVLAIAGVGALASIGRHPNIGPTASATPSAEVSAAPSPSIEATLPPLDPTSWVPYTSETYGFTVGHPTDWTEMKATRRWNPKKDEFFDAQSRAQDMFLSPGSTVAFSAVVVPTGPGTKYEFHDDLRAWVQSFCAGIGDDPCSAVTDSAIELCDEARDCHPGLLVPFGGDILAFFGGAPEDGMTVVGIWRGDSDPTVIPYGGSIRLLKAFLATMNVWPASTPFAEREPYPWPVSSPTVP